MLGNHSLQRRRTDRRLVMPLLIALVALSPGSIACRKTRAMAPVSGTVIWQGRPLRFGVVMFQPEHGQPAVGTIQADGTFHMTTRGEGDGAAVGLNQVRIACYEGQGQTGEPIPNEGERPLGTPLIAAKYLSYQTSGIIVVVRPDANPPLVLELTD